MNIRWMALLGMLLGLAVGMAAAQSTGPLNFIAPFDFVVGDAVLPAGEYTIRVVSIAGLLSFRSADGAVSAFINSLPLQKTATEDRYRLVFHRYGSHYYVSEIWTPGYRTGRTLIQTPAELEVAKSNAQQHVTLYADARAF